MGTDTKRGELGEIRTQLATLSNMSATLAGDRNALKRDLFKKIINYLTIGIDMSSLFMQVMNCAAASQHDVVLKKMLYFYITTYATANPELTLLTINLLLKDCRDQDPTIRGLALRSLCALRVANLTEYLMSPMQQGLSDGHPYVRRTAVMAVLKVYHLDQEAVRNAGLLERVREMLTADPDPQVVSNCMSVLQQAGAAQGLLTRALVISLINRIKDFSEWAQCQVLEFVAQYRPAGEQEVYDFMNALDDRLAHSNSAVVMATVKVFLHFTLPMPATHQQVLERIKEPLQTQMSRDHYETAYAVLAHFLLIAQRAPIIFSQVYTTFFCRVNEPSYVKHLKLQILSAIADETNAYEIVTELTEYVNDIDEYLAREAIKAVGRIALEVQDVAGIVERLLGFLEVGKDYVVAETLGQMADLLRRFPHMAGAALAAVATLSPADVTEPAARAAFVWMLGEHGDLVQDAPYLLEPLVKDFGAEEPAVRLALLAAALKLFFKRPPESQRLLGRALSAAVADSNQDVHDRGLLYFRLLQHSLEEARRVAAPPSAAIPAFAEDQSPELRDRIFDDFNSLAVIYRSPSSAFVKPSDAHSLGEEEEDGLPHAGHSGQVILNGPVVGPVDEGSSLLNDDEQAEALAGELIISNGGTPGTSQRPSPQPSPPPIAPQPTPPPPPAGDMLGLDELLGGSIMASPPAAPPPPPSFQLRPAPQITAAEFQGLWRRLQPSATFVEPLPPHKLAALEANRHKEFLRHAAKHNIATMASGGAPPTYRFYLHAQHASTPQRLLGEVIVSTTAATASVTIKAEDPAGGPAFQQLFQNMLASFG